MVQIRVVELGEFAEVAQIQNAIWPEFATSEEELRHQSTLDETLRSRYWLGHTSKESVALLEIGPVNGSYHPQHWALGISVIGEHRNKGVGKALYEFALEQIARSKPISITTHVHEVDEASIGFAQKRGFKEIKRDYHSVVDLAQITKVMLEEILSRQLPPGVEIMLGSDVDSPGFRGRLHTFFEETRKDIPRTMPPTPLTFEQFESAFLDPMFNWNCSTFAMENTVPVGMSVVFGTGEEGHLQQGLTAVSRHQRGKGLASKLKARVMERAIDQGYKTIGTDNDTRNRNMIAINEKLGFVKHPAIIQMMWERA